jgi:sec-independent protein translocase protein TatB
LLWNTGVFDVSLSELMIVGIVALIVIGPERLPRVARTMGHLLGRLQRYVGQVKSDINREMQLDDLKKFEAQMADEANKIKSSFTEVADELRSVESSLNASVMTAASEAPKDGASPAPTGALDTPLTAANPAADDWKLREPLPESVITPSKL